MINVTKPYLPTVELYTSYVERIFESEWLTNNGLLVQELESKLEEYLGVKNIVLVANGTLALQMAYNLIELKGEVITSPFSFVATTSSLVWEGLTPVFCDIDKESLNIDCSKIENLITETTSAIVPVHVFGNSCDVFKLEGISKKYNLKIIYDASHAFGIKVNGESILKYGDISTLSFHATKLFHTIEGGAVIVNDDNLYEKLKRMINFGYHRGTIECLGVNAKMNEFQAAMGLCVLEEIDYILEKRQQLWLYYFKKLSDRYVIPQVNRFGTNNYHYFPILLKNEKELAIAKDNLSKKMISARQYFYPSLDTLNYIDCDGVCEISNNISKRILCLPLYVGLTHTEQDTIIENLINIKGPVSKDNIF